MLRYFRRCSLCLRRHWSCPRWYKVGTAAERSSASLPNDDDESLLFLRRCCRFSLGEPVILEPSSSKLIFMMLLETFDCISMDCSAPMISNCLFVFWRVCRLGGFLLLSCCLALEFGGAQNYDETRGNFVVCLCGSFWLVALFVPPRKFPCGEIPCHITSPRTQKSSCWKFHILFPVLNRTNVFTLRDQDVPCSDRQFFDACHDVVVSCVSV